jgi:hypothetical protein
LLGDQPFQRGMIGVDRTDAPAIAALGFRPQRVGFGKQPAGVERHHIDIEVALADPMEDELAFDAEAVRENDCSIDRPAQKNEALGGRQNRHILAANSGRCIKHAALNGRGNFTVKAKIIFAGRRRRRTADARKGSSATIVFPEFGDSARKISIADHSEINHSFVAGQQPEKILSRGGLLFSISRVAHPKAVAAARRMKRPSCYPHSIALPVSIRTG